MYIIHYIDKYGEKRIDIISKSEVKNIKNREDVRMIFGIENTNTYTKWKPFPL